MSKKLTLKELYRLAKGEGTNCCSKEASRKNCCTLQEAVSAHDKDDDRNQGCCS